MSTDAVRTGSALLLLALLSTVPAGAVEIDPVIELGVQQNGNPDVVGEEPDSRTGVRASVLLPLLWDGPKATTRLAYRVNGDLYRSRDDDPDRNDLGHALSASHERTLSRRASLGLRLGASRSEQQGILQDDLSAPAGTPGSTGVPAFVPRTSVTRVDAGVAGRVGTGNRSFVAWGVGARRDVYDDPPGLDLVDSTETGVDGAWGYDLGPGSTVSVRAEARRVDSQDAEEVDILSLSAGGTRPLGRRLAGSLELGASRAELPAGDSATEPRIQGSLAFPLPPHASLAFSAGQEIRGSNGLLRSASVSRHVSLGWNWSPPRGVSASASASWGRREPLEDQLDQGGTQSLETRESLGWTPGGRFTYGVAHSWRKQDALDAAAALFATDYHAFEAFVRWLPFGRRERREDPGGA